MNLSTRISFYDQLATMTQGGIPLRQILDRSWARWHDPEIDILKKSLDQQSGAADGFAAAGFSSFEVKLVAAGERSGRLDESFRQLRTYWKTESDLVGAMWKDMAYPIILLHVLAVLGPIPKLVTSGVAAFAMQALTQLVMLYVVAFAVFWVVRVTWRSEDGQSFWLKVPLAGRFLRSTYAYRWIVALRMELNAGIPFSQAIPDAWEATGFSARARRAEEARQGILNGESLSILAARWRELPEDWITYFSTAEVSGKINETMTNVEDLALTEWKRSQERLADWMPKLVYVAILFYAAFQTFNTIADVYGNINHAFDAALPGT